ncbi:MAG: hypothetical protein U9O97_05105 [Elusimicrobiota bacterium]|nr:hypothetical protein [Elusimicrobiota bacterium]
MTTKGFFALLKTAAVRKKHFFFTTTLLVLFIAVVLVVKKYPSFKRARSLRGLSAGRAGAAGEKAGLTNIKKTVKEKKYLESEKLLRNFLEAKHSKEEKYEARFTLGYVYLSLGRWKRAFQEFKLVSTASPPHKRSPDATYMAAELLDRKFADREKAMKYYRKYVQMWPHGRLARRAVKKIVRD